METTYNMYTITKNDKNFRKIGIVTVEDAEWKLEPVCWSSKKDPIYVVAMKKATAAHPKTGRIVLTRAE